MLGCSAVLVSLPWWSGRVCPQSCQYSGGGMTILSIVIGNLAYLILPCMKSYAGWLDARKKLFSSCLSGCYMTVECTFGCFKAHWKALGVCMDIPKHYLPDFVIFICVLYINCKAKEEPYHNVWTEEARCLKGHYSALVPECPGTTNRVLLWGKPWQMTSWDSEMWGRRESWASRKERSLRTKFFFVNIMKNIY